MRKTLSALLLCLFGAAVVMGRARDAVGESPPGALPSTGFAVLELFTSEGCSSCPAADQVLSEIDAEQRAGQVFPLSFHVDYWDDLGWKDPFSNAQFSLRQRNYAQAMGMGRIYTPQLVINGRAELVGSRADAVRAVIERALARPATPQPSIALTAERGEAGLVVAQRVERAPSSARLSLLVVQDWAQNKVMRGENASRTLRHVQIVRSISEASPQGHSVLALPSGLAPPHATVVALLQDPVTLAVLAAARTSIAVR